MKKNTVRPGKARMTIRYGACVFACSLNKATDTQPEYVTLHVFARLVWLRERACLLRVYVHCLSF